MTFIPCRIAWLRIAASDFPTVAFTPADEHPGETEVGIQRACVLVGVRTAGDAEGELHAGHDAAGGNRADIEQNQGTRTRIHLVGSSDERRGAEIRVGVIREQSGIRNGGYGNRRRVSRETGRQQDYGCQKRALGKEV